MDRGNTWIFGYGSLIWNPGFEPAEQVLGRLSGYARSFCMWSIHHRGTPEEPGLVLALDSDDAATCDGMAFRVPEHSHDKIIAYIRERELVSSAYLEERVALTLRDGREIEALAYVVDRDHEQYTGHLDIETQADVIARARGGRGPNTDYLYSTAEHLTDLGIEDRTLTQLAALVRAKL
ncbi:gamma-glutamylcyclotransferase [Shimia ponticola]|uniref:gamma-glutamylcyclotransferase n=1 Tax=Shimia ponticola TaxID=2582893 RepID=UPI0011BEB322|nr:gamma-glutamylcyclotransferase [Shimia ponticola]